MPKMPKIYSFLTQTIFFSLGVVGGVFEGGRSRMLVSETPWSLDDY